MAREVTVGEWSITTYVTGGNWKENCYLMAHGRTGDLLLIDPGSADPIIADHVVAAGGQLRHMLLTHAHHDHVGGVVGLSRQFGVSCRLHRSDVRLLRHAPMYALRFSKQTIETPKDHEVYGEEPLILGGQVIQVLPVPGHTAGSVCLALGGVVFTGDTLMYEIVGRVDLPGSEPDRLIPSINHLLAALPTETVIFPGHGRPWTIGEAKAWWSRLEGPAPAYKEPYAN